MTTRYIIKDKIKRTLTKLLKPFGFTICAWCFIPIRNTTFTCHECQMKLDELRTEEARCDYVDDMIAEQEAKEEAYD